MTTATTERTTSKDHDQVINSLIETWSSHTDSNLTSRLAVTTTGDKGEIIQPDVLEQDYDSENLSEFKNLLSSIITDSEESDKTANITVSYYHTDDVELTEPQQVFTWDVKNGKVNPTKTDASEPGWSIS